MDIGKTIIIPRKLTVTFKLRVRSIGCTVRVLPYIPFAGKRCPVAFWDNLLVTEVLIPDQRRVRLSAEHFKGQLESRRRPHHIAIHIFELSGSESVGGVTGIRFFREGSADTETVELHTVDTNRNGQRMFSRRKAHSLGKCRPEGSSPIRPPQTAFRKMHGVTIQ